MPKAPELNADALAFLAGHQHAHMMPCVLLENAQLPKAAVILARLFFPCAVFTVAACIQACLAQASVAFPSHCITALILFHKSDRFKTAIIILCFRPKHSRTSYNVYAISACFSFWQIHTLSFTIMGFIIITSTTFHFPYSSFSCTTAGSFSYAQPFSTIVPSHGL